MHTFPVSAAFLLSLAAYSMGAVVSLASWRKPAVARKVGCGMALAGGALGGLAAMLGILQGSPVQWSVPSGIPLFAYSFSYDALGGFFNLILAILAIAVSLYSFGYLKEFEGRRNIGFFGFLFHVLLLSLTIVFTAANAFLFLIGWEVMALAAYGLVAFYHEQRESRQAGLLYIIMAHADVGCLLLGFALLIQGSGSAEFASFHSAAAAHLSSGRQSAAFVLFFLGFGIKAGVIPFHIWLPAAHPVAPSNASALLSGIVIKSGIYGMTRIFLDSLGGVPSWAGLAVLIVGVISAVLGVLYALMEHDLKRLLAYHSIENIGIILMGLGAALIFRVAGHPLLAGVALIAAMFHTLNHAIFKCLLFLGAGSVLHSTGTRNMEEMGGLIRPMPVTAFCFLIGAVAISGLPPLNGFVSEWLTYQSLLAGFGATGGLTRILFPLAGSMLALTGALAAACFVKAFAITFLALPRGEQSHPVHEAPRSMLVGMGSLTVACIALGLGMTWFLPVFGAMTEQLLGLRIGANLIAANRLVLSAGVPHGGTVSTVVIAVGLVMLLVPAALLVSIGTKRFGRKRGPVWDCGLPGLTGENEYTATAFSKALRMVFSVLYKPRREIQAVFDVSPYFPKEIRFESEIEPTFEKRLYAPLQELIFTVSAKMRAIQAGSVHAYLAYIFNYPYLASAFWSSPVTEVLANSALQFVLVLLLAPLLSGLMNTLKARLQTRRGPGILQSYRDIFKLLRKGMVIPETASWIFSAAPYMVFGTATLVGLMIPMTTTHAPLSLFGGVLAVVYLLALGRFFLALGGLDTGSSFGGLGSSREMTISAIAEPAMMLAIFTVALGANSTNLSEMAKVAVSQSWRFLAPSQMLAFAALFIVLIAETGRIPVDNPATHLELTMIHEAMVLEYSGPYLALIEWGSSIKQLVLMTLLVNTFFPFGLSSDWTAQTVTVGLAYYFVKLLLLACMIVLVETLNAKLRLFRVPELLMVAFILGALALISTFLF